MCINDPEVMLKATALCDMYGMDICMIGAIISWAMRRYENRMLMEKDTDGLKLLWENSESTLKLNERMAS